MQWEEPPPAPPPLPVFRLGGCSLEIAPHPQHAVLPHRDRNRLGETHIEGDNGRGVVAALQQSVEVICSVVQYIHASQVERLQL